MQTLADGDQTDALRILLDRLNAQYTRQSISSLKAHPEYPSLLALNHTLHQLRIDNAAVRVSYEQLQHELPKPLLVHMQNGRNMYRVVDKLDEETIYFVNRKGKLEAQPKEEFLKTWSGVAMLVDDQAQGKEENYSLNRLKERLYQLRIPLAITALLLIVFYTIYYYSPVFTAFDYLYLLTKALGVAVSIPLLMHLIDKNNPLVQKLCTSGNPKSRTNCNSILDSPAATFLGVFAWSEIGFVYFASLLGYLLLFPQAHNLALVAALAVAAAPYTVYSVYYQWRVVRQWCRLCLAVQGILWVELGVAIAFFSMETDMMVTFQSIFSLLLVFCLVVSAYSFLKPVVADWKRYKDQMPRLNKIKYEPAVFQALLQKTQPIDTSSVTPIQLQLGNPQGEHRLTIISNPTCGPCIEMHRKLFQRIPTVKRT